MLILMPCQDLTMTCDVIDWSSGRVAVAEAISTRWQSETKYRTRSCWIQRRKGPLPQTWCSPRGPWVAQGTLNGEQGTLKSPQEFNQMQTFLSSLQHLQLSSEIKDVSAAPMLFDYHTLPTALHMLFQSVYFLQVLVICNWEEQRKGLVWCGCFTPVYVPQVWIGSEPASVWKNEVEIGWIWLDEFSKPNQIWLDDSAMSMSQVAPRSTRSTYSDGPRGFSFAGFVLYRTFYSESTKDDGKS